MNIGEWVTSYGGNSFSSPSYSSRDEAVAAGIELYEGESFFVAQIAIIKEEVVDTEFKKTEETE